MGLVKKSHNSLSQTTWGVDVSGSVREDEKINLEKVKEFVRTVRKVGDK